MYEIIWGLLVKASLPGANVDLAFCVPVYKVPEDLVEMIAYEVSSKEFGRTQYRVYATDTTGRELTLASGIPSQEDAAWLVQQIEQHLERRE